MANASANHHDWNKFKTVLEARIAEVECALHCRDVIAVEQTADQLEEIQQASERTLAISNLDRGSQELWHARAALRRISEGVFGVCEECGEEIHPRRLQAIPWAALCIHCQEEVDLSQQCARKFGDNLLTYEGSA